MAMKNSPKGSSPKTRGRDAALKAAPTHLDSQRQIRNAGSNRVTGSADHLHRGDRRDTNTMK